MTICLSIATSKLGLEIGEKFLKEIKNLDLQDIKNLGLICESSDLPECLIHIVLVATGGTEEILMNVAEKAKLTYILYTDKYNSLPATIEAFALIRKRGFKAKVRKFSNDLKFLINKLRKVSSAYSEIKKARLGLIGGESPWLIYSRIDFKKLKIGELVHIPFEEFQSEFERASVDFKFLEKILANAHSIHLNNIREEIAKAIKVYKALKKIVEKYELKGLTLKCFDVIEKLDTTSCLALALLNNDLIPAACEGDVPLLYTMTIATILSGKPVFMANPTVVEEDEVILAHCTSWLSGNYSLYKHFESNKGVALRVDYPIGLEATIFRLDADLAKMRIGVGSLVENEWSQYMCRTQVKVKLKNAFKIVEESIGNHYALLIGNYLEELQLLAELLDIDVELF